MFKCIAILSYLSVAVPVTFAVTIETVPIGDPGNAADDTGFGTVGYPFRMGKFEITNAQYVEFLNAKASTSDPFQLYDSFPAGLSVQGGYSRSGRGGNYTYHVKPDQLVGSGRFPVMYTYANKPVVDIDWYDAIRFANWMHNGQGNGDTETGAYTLLGGTPVPSNADTISRNPGAKWFLPNKDEWYKAAYYDPQKPGGAGYYDYPTGSDEPPDNNLPEADSGNSANYQPGGPGPIPRFTTGDREHPLVDVGAYALSASPAGTFNQAGNVTEWTEEFYLPSSNTSPVSRGRSGSNWIEEAKFMGSDQTNNSTPFWGFSTIGFRLATVVPEPEAHLLILTALCLAPFVTPRR